MTEDGGDADVQDCPYCPGTLYPVEDHEHLYQCDGDDCPARFVAVFPAMLETNGGAVDAD